MLFCSLTKFYEIKTKMLIRCRKHRACVGKTYLIFHQFLFVILNLFLYFLTSTAQDLNTNKN